MAFLGQATPGLANPTPWAHVTSERREKLRTAYSALLRERVSTSSGPRLLPPPPPSADTPALLVEGGCLMCGVNHVAVPADRVTRLGGPTIAAHKVWRERTVTRGPDRLRGHVCPACADALDALAAWGPSAVERAYTRWLDASNRHTEAENLRVLILDNSAPALPTYAALVHVSTLSGLAAPSPSQSPWEHLSRRR